MCAAKLQRNGSFGNETLWSDHGMDFGRVVHVSISKLAMAIGTQGVEALTHFFLYEGVEMRTLQMLT